MFIIKAMLCILTQNEIHSGAMATMKKHHHINFRIKRDGGQTNLDIAFSQIIFPRLINAEIIANDTALTIHPMSIALFPTW